MMLPMPKNSQHDKHSLDDILTSLKTLRSENTETIRKMKALEKTIQTMRDQQKMGH